MEKILITLKPLTLLVLVRQATENFYDSSEDGYLEYANKVCWYLLMKIDQSSYGSEGEKPADGNHSNHRAGQRYYPEG
ncbi:MAG: hypothetical protein GXY37_08510 [Chloroflexi bacterium]|nr:hypothetical protein [Chloroflexota bacterium]